MEFFQYLAVSFSIVLSFAVVRILGGISEVFTRPRVYWVHAAWVIHLLLMLAFSWWRIWAYYDATWNILGFLSVLTATSLLYYQSAMLVPANAGSILSWQEYFFTVRRQFFGAAIAWMILVTLNTSLIQGVSIVHSTRISPLVTLVISIIGMSTNNHRVHSLLVVLMLSLWPLRAYLVFDAPSGN